MCELCDPELLRVADINNDGVDDMVVYLEYTNEIVWFNNIESGDFTSFESLFKLSEEGIEDMLIGDLDGDLILDIIIGSDNGISVYMDNTGSLFYERVTLIEDVNFIRDLEFAQIDDDEDLDLAVIGFVDYYGSNFSSLTILVNDGEGNLTRPGGFPLSFR